jgi:hypothetical protein
MVLESGSVSTTFPFCAGAWHISQLLSAKGGWGNRCINLGDADWCGLWQAMQSAVAKG